MPYTPKPPPRTKPEFQELYDYIEQELQGISRELLETSQLELRTTYKEPVRPREGMIAQADGTTWNPGEGAGTYKYENGAWVKFGDADHQHVLADVTDAGVLAGLDTVALSDMANLVANRLIGRNTNSTGIPEAVSLTQLLDWIGSATQGDILVRGASVWARLGIGASGKVLTSDGTDLSWGNAPGWTSLQTNSPTSGSSSDFVNISQAHKILLFIGRDLDFSNSTSNIDLKIGTTSSFGAFYTIKVGAFNVVGSTVSGGSASSTAPNVAAQSTDGTTAFFTFILDYASTTKRKLWFSLGIKAQSTTDFTLRGGYIDTTNAIEHVRFNNSANTFVGGSIEMVGLL